MDWLIRRTDPLTRAAGPPMRLLASGLDRPAVLLLCQLFRGKVMCIAQDAVGFPSFASSYERGRPMPLFRGAASKIILANLSDRAITALFKRHPEATGEVNLGSTSRETKSALVAIRRHGLCVTSGENLTNVLVSPPSPAKP